MGEQAVGRSSQRKGRAAERELAHVLQSYGYDVRPGNPLNYGKEADLVGLPMIHCECKRAETLRLSEWLAQAEHDAEKFGDGLPTVFHRRNRESWRVTMPLESWVQLYEKAQGRKCGGHCNHQENQKGV